LFAFSKTHDFDAIKTTFLGALAQMAAIAREFCSPELSHNSEAMTQSTQKKAPIAIGAKQNY